MGNSFALRPPGTGRVTRWPTPPALDCFTEATLDLYRETTTLGAGVTGKADELAALRQSRKDAEVALTEESGKAAREGTDAPKDTLAAIDEKIAKCEADLAAGRAAVEQAHDDLGESMALDAAEYAPRKISELLDAATIEAVAEVQRASKAVERVQRLRDLSAYLSIIRSGSIPKPIVKAWPVATTLKKPNGSPLPAAEALDSVKEALGEVVSRCDGTPGVSLTEEGSAS